MRNYYFLLSVLAVTIWTSRGDQTGNLGGTQNDFYDLDDMEEQGSGDLYSSYSAYNPSSIMGPDDEDQDTNEDIDEPGSGEPMPVVLVSGSIHLNRDFIDAYNNPDNLKYTQLEMEFKLAMDELMYTSPLRNNYLSIRVIRFSPGSVKVDFVVEIEDMSRVVESLSKVIEVGINTGSFTGLNANASSLVIQPLDTNPGVTLTTTAASGRGDITPSNMPIQGSMHLNKVYISAYDNPNSIKYIQLEMEFKLAMDEVMNASPLRDNYIGTNVIGFSPGSVKVDFEVELAPMNGAEESLGRVIESGVNSGGFSELSPNVSSLVIKPRAMTPIPTKEGGMGDGDKYRPGDDDSEVDLEEKNILDMILNDPIIIAAIAGGIVVILLSIILLFLFVVYRLKKKDEGSYSLDEPAKAKDPTAYWKETKEFYA